MDDGLLQVTVSIGTASLNDHQDLSRLMKQADVGLYDAKHAGRNQYKIAQETA